MAIFRSTLLYGNKSWMDSGNIINNLEVKDVRVNKMIAMKSR